VQIGDSDDLAAPAVVAPGFAPALYAQTLRAAPGLDGSRDDWAFARVAPGADDNAMAIELADGSRAWLGVYPPFLF
ncbi:hypothetical protein WFJ45_23795, partial [Salmonella enterica subsp. enterica serovar Minnesota]|uniref:hypothetical protein n=1 Tax=Salmonella enterica TaxID=28901 RepID=UPI003D2C642C